MSTNRHEHVLEVWGDFACFSRPEMKVERYSYPCPTPSAARGVFEAIYFKPAIRWQVTRIELLHQPSYIALRRNEVKEKASVNAIKKWMKGTAEPEPIWADGDKALLGSDQKGRTQRQTMALREPRFRLTARLETHRGADRPLQAYDDQFVRRARQGKCFQQPYLGCREFVCFFRYVESLEGEPEPVPYSQDLGFMLYDVFDLATQNAGRAEQEHANKKKRRVNQAAISVFQANIKNGVLEVPPYDSEAVLKATRRAG